MARREMAMIKGNKMDNVKKRSSLIDFKCPYCEKGMVVAPVFHYDKKTNKRYEAWAIIWFEKDKYRKGRPPCKVIYEDIEFAPSTAATNIMRTQINGWTWWKYKHEKGDITLEELALMY